MQFDEHRWPDALDWLGLSALFALLVVAPAVGYVLVYLDYRAYLRSLRRALVIVRGYATSMPAWVIRDSPPCLAALGLSRGCTREDVLAAYRAKVKHMHPDAGGSRTEFARLQQHFEDAMALIEAGEG